MIKETIYIEKPIEEVWNFIELEFAKVFKTSPSKLLGKTIEAETMNFTGKVIAIRQEVTIQEKPHRLIIQSESGRDLVETEYILETDEAGTGTYLTASESGKGKKSTLRSLNYSLMSLPILRGSAKKKVRARIEGIKILVEGEAE
ncbi:hypothetical protein [Erysipelothrix anatis]|uniref:hypothetical protein n=1 Tax=Erysipelothrix anatis TaxID=2683713 RepID=UPI0014085532|nr:hypothetical protein [Erysipelothrix anatis]